MNARHWLLGAALAATATACGRPDDGSKPLTHSVKIDVGGAVFYEADPTERLEGVTVTLTDLDGDTETAITGAGGLWTIENIAPGVYVETYEGVGLETVNDSFGIDAGGPQDIANIFVARPDVAMHETELVAVVAGAFSASVKDGESPADGFLGNAFTYSTGTLSVTFSRVLLPFGEVYLDDGDQQYDADRSDTATQTVFTFQAGDLAQLVTDSDPLTFVELRMDVAGLTPLHGDIEGFDAVLRFNALP